ncbi:uncharacterized protein LOC128987254 [Macrosteles quadrilineatus]|uniref:uncharacterized protein LOC128987254 n=1 Tax=Macrosteles quadrilineatus TaxID=74068 RepID=UPI0023E32E21|nr:uncharacterized protein LOC128987254 [Macrosteles quadrilineatus]
MADISKDDLKTEIAAILKDADLTKMSAKKVREEIEEKLDCDLSSRKKEIDDLVMQCLKEKKGSGKKSGKKNGKKDSDDEGGDDDGEDEEEEEEEEEGGDEDGSEEEEKPKRAAKKPAPKRKKGSSEESEEEDEKDSDDEYSPAKKAKGKPKGKGRKKKKGSDSDSDEDWGKNKAKAKKGGGGKRGGGGYTKVCTLTPELAAVVGQDSMARHEVVKKVWAIIKEKNLYDPKNKQFAICNDDLFKVFGVKRFRTFGMMKYLKDHFVD